MNEELSVPGACGHLDPPWHREASSTDPPLPIHVGTLRQTPRSKPSWEWQVEPTLGLGGPYPLPVQPPFIPMWTFTRTPWPGLVEGPQPSPHRTCCQRACCVGDAALWRTQASAQVIGPKPPLGRLLSEGQPACALT